MTLVQPSFAWVYWDPPRYAFTLPYFHHPIAWYGICFAFGFILGVLLIIPILKRRILIKKTIQPRDVANWPLLIADLKKGFGDSDPRYSKILHQLNSNAQIAIKQFKIKQEPGNALKQEILQVLSASMTSPNLQLNREELETLFPKGLWHARDLAVSLTDRMTWFVLAGAIIGARLGHVFFYDWPRYQAHPIEIFKVWEGGIASHGGTVGIMLALFFFLQTIRNRFSEFTFIDLLDILCIPTALACVWIRVGNFINQEILGPATNLPWAVVFGHPYNGEPAVPRHPTQLYEAVAYLLTFVFLFFLWSKYGEKVKKGTLIGLFMICVFGSRFFIEFLKIPQSLMIDEAFLNMGQYLSIPFVFMGLSLLYFSLFKSVKNKSSYTEILN